MKAEDYNSLVVTLFDSMGVISSTIDQTIDLGISSIPLPSSPAIIASVDTLIIAESEKSTYIELVLGIIIFQQTSIILGPT